MVSVTAAGVTAPRPTATSPPTLTAPPPVATTPPTSTAVPTVPAPDPSRVVAPEPIGVGAFPAALALSADKSWLLVVNTNPFSSPRRGTVSVIDTAARRIVATIQLDVGDAERIAVTPDGTRAYVAVGDRVDALDLRTRVVTPIRTGFSDFDASDVLIDSGGRRVYVSNRTADTVSVIDADPTSATFHTLVATIRVGPGNTAQPYGLALAPGGRWLYVANRAGKGVAIIDTTARTVVYAQISITTAPSASGFYGRIAVRPDGERAYVVYPNSNQIAVLDLDLGRQVASLRTEGANLQDVAVSGDGRLLFVVAGSPTNALMIFDLDSASPSFMTVIAAVAVPAIPNAVVYRGLADALAYVLSGGRDSGLVSTVRNR